MRVLLVNPPPYRIVEPMFDTPVFPRTALAVLGGYLRHKGVDVQVMDCKYDRLNYDHAVQRVKYLKPDVVGLTAMTNEIKPAAHLARLIKEILPKTRTVIGGVHVQAMPGSCLREFPEFDFGVVGEGQETLYELVSRFGDYELLAATQGVCFLNERGQYIYGGDRPRNSDLDSIYYPAWDMFKPAVKYIFQTSLGCPFRCPFCMNPNGRRVRLRSPEKVLDEIELTLELGRLKTFQFGDEAFTLSRKHAEAICRGIVDREIHKRANWFCVTHIRGLDAEIVRLMKQANCFRIAIGVETADMQLLKNMGKGLTRESIESAAQMLHRMRMPFETLFILGHPEETYQSAMCSIDFTVALNPTIPIFGIMVPYPGTRIWEMAQRGEGGYRNLSKDWNDYNKHVGNAVEFENLSRQELERIQMLGYLKVFIWNRRFVDLVKFIWDYRTPAFGAIRQWLRRVLGFRSTRQPNTTKW